MRLMDTTVVVTAGRGNEEGNYRNNQVGRFAWINWLGRFFPSWRFLRRVNESKDGLNKVNELF